MSYIVSESDFIIGKRRKATYTENYFMIKSCTRKNDNLKCIQKTFPTKGPETTQLFNTILPELLKAKHPSIVPIIGISSNALQKAYLL